MMSNKLTTSSLGRVIPMLRLTCSFHRRYAGRIPSFSADMKLAHIDLEAIQSSVRSIYFDDELEELKSKTDSLTGQLKAILESCEDREKRTELTHHWAFHIEFLMTRVRQLEEQRKENPMCCKSMASHTGGYSGIQEPVNDPSSSQESTPLLKFCLAFPQEPVNDPSG